MRKFTAIFLVLVLVFGLFGCSNSKNQNKKPDYSLSDLLIYQAEELARQIGMQAEKGYMDAMELPADVVSLAGVFQLAATADPVSAQLQAGVVETLPRDIAQLCGHFAGTSKLAGCSALTVSREIFLAEALDQPAAVYLRYSDECHFIVVFTPAAENLVSVWAYPLYAEVAEKVLRTYFAGAQVLDPKQIREASKSGAKAQFQAQYTEQKTDAAHYIKLATATLKQGRPLKPKDIAEYSTDQKIINKVVITSQFMVSGIQSVQVYRFPNRVEEQVDALLQNSGYRQELEAYTRQQVYLTFPQQLCNRYGQDWIVVSSILSAAMETGKMTATSSEKETPVLVVMNLRGGSCLVMSIYPNAHHVYTYRYAVLPITYPEITNLLVGMGAAKLN